MLESLSTVVSSGIVFVTEFPAAITVDFVMASLTFSRFVGHILVGHRNPTPLHPPLPSVANPLYRAGVDFHQNVCLAGGPQRQKLGFLMRKKQTKSSAKSFSLKKNKKTESVLCTVDAEAGCLSILVKLHHSLPPGFAGAKMAPRVLRGLLSYRKCSPPLT